jgi:hypothetical protein
MATENVTEFYEKETTNLNDKVTLDEIFHLSREVSDEV